MRSLVYIVLVLSVFSFCTAANAQAPAPLSLLAMKAGAEKRLAASSAQVTVASSADPAAPGLDVSIQPGPDGYPGISLKPEGAPWNLSAYGHVEARIVNTGTQTLALVLRLDNAGDWHDSPWDTESVSLAPGQSATVKTIFGYANGFKPGYPLKPAAVVNLLLFTTSADTPRSFRLEALAAAGPADETPPLPPIPIRPVGGVLLKGGTADNSVSGLWDLRDYSEVRIKVRNTGKTPVTPRTRIESKGGSSDWISAAAPLAPGAEGEITVPFAGAIPATLNQPETLDKITSDTVSAVIVDNAAGQKAVRIESVLAASPAATLPGWLGKRPPVPGDWVKTLDDDFNGTKVNDAVWSIYGDNYWDKESHWSKDDLLVGDGLVRLRYEKKHGHNNDDPTQNQTDYAAGYLHTYGKWTQRYGYFEARMKLPTAPGLWPAFWMMPDRGLAAGPEQWKRQDTAFGGMEFDIMEHLTRWGPHRYNIAMHYDGYGKDHKMLGSDKIYVQPDKDGFLTCGLLWSPGSAVYYCNGKEVLRWDSPRVSTVPANLIFTVPSGGWDNSPLDDSRLPDSLVIDYVRVWQLQSRLKNSPPRDYF